MLRGEVEDDGLTFREHLGPPGNVCDRMLYVEIKRRRENRRIGCSSGVA